jgi:hypothetical protein
MTFQNNHFQPFLPIGKVLKWYFGFVLSPNSSCKPCTCHLSENHQN